MTLPRNVPPNTTKPDAAGAEMQIPLGLFEPDVSRRKSAAGTSMASRRCALANAIMKTETKAKRRATLSICGLGFLDESEIETIPRTARARNAAIAELPEAERREAAERAAEEFGERVGGSMIRNMTPPADQEPPHDDDGVVWDGEDGEPRTVTARDFEATTGVLKASYIESVRRYIRASTDAKALHQWWNSDQQKTARRDFELDDRELRDLMDFCSARIAQLKRGNGERPQVVT